MRSLTLVTGNQHKLEEWRRMVPRTIELMSADLDLEEIQSLDLEEIVLVKAKAAFEKIGSPVVVEDVSAGLDELNGLPGPFIKFFEIELGKDALYQLVKTSPAATATCLIAYYDGRKSLVVRADVHGTAVPLKVANGFGFDGVFVPDGQTKTYAEMTPAQKDAISHRSQALKKFIQQLREL